MSIFISSCRDSHPQGNLWDPSHKAGQIYGEASGREAERSHLKICLQFPSGVRQGRRGGMNQHTQLPLKIWASVEVELCLKERTAQLLCSLTGISKEAILVLYHVLASVVRPRWICHPGWGTTQGRGFPHHSTCTPVMQRQLQSSRSSKGHSGTLLSKLHWKLRHTLTRKLSDRTEPLARDRSCLRSVLAKASLAGTPLVGQLLSAPGMLCHIPLATGIPLPHHPPHTQHSQLCICLFTIFKIESFLPQGFKLTWVHTRLPKTFFINKQAPFTK